MTESQYHKSIGTNRLQLDSFQKFMYYGGMIFLFCGPTVLLICHLTAWLNDNDATFAQPEIYIVIIPTILGVLEYRRQNNKLIFRKIATNFKREELQIIIEDIAKQLEWQTQIYDEQVYIAKTFPGIFSMSWGEQITIIFCDNYVLINSINSPDDRPAFFDMGRNKLNRETLIKRISTESI